MKSAGRSHVRRCRSVYLFEMSTTLPPFEEIVTAHGPTVLRVCRAVLGPMDADDAWSETFLAAMRAYPTLRPGSNDLNGT
jgi:DNA-directed RNA polymerase specialized sigma24 family protein